MAEATEQQKREKWLKDYFDAVRKVSVKNRKKRQKAKKENQENSDTGEHTNKYSKYYAILWKSSIFAKRGSRFIKNDNSRNIVYRTFKHTDKAFSEGSSNMLKRNAKFPGGLKVNFDKEATYKKNGETKKANQDFPYVWEAHHIIPLSAFTLEVEPGKPLFEGVHRDLLMMSNYDINHGHNIIHLPAAKALWAVPVHSLLQHPSDHRNYTLKVQERMQEIVDALDEAIDEDKPHEAIIVDIMDQLKSIEQSLWDLIVDESDKAVAKRIAQLSANTDDGMVKDWGNWAKLS